MRDNISGIIAHGEFHKSINLELFHAMLAMIAHMSEKEEALRQWRSLHHSVIWWENYRDYESYFKTSGLRYPGEVLERYEEYFGSKPENLRAVALALGYAAPFLTPSLFVGRQKEDFQKRLVKESGQDVYLQGARYLLEPNPSIQQLILKEMSSRKYKKTEEVVFVLSLYLNHTEGFQAMWSQLVQLWGEEHSISLIENAGMLEWLITEYKGEIRKCRKKDCTILKALISLAFMQVKEESQVFSVLVKAGYSKLEIAYANSVMVWTDKIYDGMDEDGMIAEKVAAECCVTLINYDGSLGESMYSYLGYLLSRYEKFKIRYEGNQGIGVAIESRILPVMPRTVLWLLQNTKMKRMREYRFDVFEQKWDILQENLDARLYHELFTWQLLSQKNLPECQIQRLLKRYFELTGTDYLLGFQHQWMYNQASFAYLVEQKVINLWDFFQKHKKDLTYWEEAPQEILYVWGYVMSIWSRSAYDFMVLFLKEYGLAGIETYFGSRKSLHGSMVKNLEKYHTVDTRVEFRRDFLSAEEHRQLFEWLDESVFRKNPSEYSDFVVAALKNDLVRELYSKEELKQILNELLSQNAVKAWEIKALKEFYFSREEIDADNARIEARKAEEIRKKKEAELNKIKEKLEKYSDGTFSSLQAFFLGYHYWEEELKKAFVVSDEYLIGLIESQEGACEAKEFAAFLCICMEGIHRNALPKEKVLRLLDTMIRRGYYVADT